MTTIHETVPRRSSELVTKQEAVDLSSNYRKFITTQLELLGMTSLSAADNVKTKSAQEYKDVLVMGLPFPDPNAVAMLAAADNQMAEDMLAVFTVPTETGFPLMRDERDNSFWCNFFYQKEGDVLQPVHTSDPIRVHGILPQMQVLDGRQNGLEEMFPKNAALNRIAASKWKTKKMFAAANLSVPRGFLVEDGVDDPTALIASMQRIAGISPAGLVVKADMSSEGERVQMFHSEKAGEAVEYGEYLLSEGHDVIIEERILPYPLPIGEGEVPTDYNLRVITSLGEHPKIIAAEVRSSTMSGDPVNVARGAIAYPAYKLLEQVPEEVLSRVYEAALIGSEVLTEAVGGIGGSELLQLIGFDIIPAQDGKAYILEINPTGGGIGTLTRLAGGRPPDGIFTKFFPEVGHALLKSQNDKRPDERYLQRLPLDSVAYEVAAYILHDAKEHERVLYLMNEALATFPYHREYRKMVAHTYFAAGHYEKASEWYALSERYAPSDTRTMIQSATSALLAGDLEDVLGILDENTSEKSIEEEAYIAGLRALTLLRSTDDLGGAISEFSDHYPEPISKRGARRELLRMKYELDSLALEKTPLPNDPFTIPDWLSLLY